MLTLPPNVSVQGPPKEIRPVEKETEKAFQGMVSMTHCEQKEKANKKGSRKESPNAADLAHTFLACRNEPPVGLAVRPE